MRRETMRFQQLLCRLGHQLKASLHEDYRQRVETAGIYIETLLVFYPPLAKEAWTIMKGLYHDSNNSTPTPARITIERITAE